MKTSQTMSKQLRHVSEIKDSEIEPIRELVELYISEQVVERDIAFAVIDLFTIKNDEDEKE